MHMLCWREKYLMKHNEFLLSANAEIYTSLSIPYQSCVPKDNKENK